MKNSFFIVEDYSLMLHGISSWLSENSKWTCAGTAKDKQEALYNLEKLCSSTDTEPSVVLTDINLGNNSYDLSGIQFIKEIISLYPNIKCICYSMYKSPGIIQLALNAGAMGYISKSATEKELITCMDQVQSGLKYIEKNLLPSISTYKEAVSSLTKKELMIANLMVNHKNNDEISQILGIRKRTVESYTSRIYDKIGCKSRNQLIEILS